MKPEWQSGMSRDAKLQWQREYARHKRSEFAAWFSELKSGACSDCGQRWPPEAMQFDHVRGQKVASVGRMAWSWSNIRTKKKILEEIAKCDLVCACCHAIRTARRKRGSYLPATR